MADTYLTVGSFFLVLLVGIAFGKSGRLGTGTDQAITKIVFNFTLPCAIVHSFGATHFEAPMAALVLVGLACTVTPWVASFLVSRRWPAHERVLQQCNIAGFNIGCFSLPFIQALLPPVAAVYTCLFDAGNALMMTGGTYALTTSLVMGEGPHERRAPGVAGLVRAAAVQAGSFVRKVCSSVAFDVYVIMVLLGLLGVSVPGVLISLTVPAANANGFLSMFMLGLTFKADLSAGKLRELVRLLAMRWGFSLVMALAVWFCLPLPQMQRAVVVVLLFAPMGSLGPVFTLWCRSDVGLAGLANACTILVAILVMPALMLALGLIG